MKREDLFLAIGEVEEERLAACEAVYPFGAEPREDNNMGKFVYRKKGRIFRGLLIAAVVVGMLATTAFATFGYLIYDSPEEMLNRIFGDETGFDHNDGRIDRDPNGGEDAIMVDPTFDRVETDDTVVAEDVAPYVSPVGQSISWLGYTLTVDAYLYDSTTQSGFVTYLLENPDGVSGYNLQSNGRIWYSGARDMVDTNPSGYPYIIQEKTTDTCLAVICYFKRNASDGEELQIGFTEASNYTNKEIGAMQAQLKAEYMQQMTEEEILNACRMLWGETLFDEVINEVGEEEIVDVCCEHLAAEELTRRFEAESCKNGISISLADAEALDCLTLADGGVTVTPISVQIDTTGLGLTHMDSVGDVHSDSSRVDSLVIRYRDGSEYMVSEGYVVNYAFAMSELPDDNVQTEVIVPPEEDPMGEGYAMIVNSREYCIHTFMFNRIIDIDNVSAVIINGTEFLVS